MAGASNSRPNARRKAQTTTTLTLTCANPKCGKRFVAKQRTDGSWQRTCSSHCAGSLGGQNRAPRRMYRCKNTVTRVPHEFSATLSERKHGRRQFCSIDCRREFDAATAQAQRGRAPKG